MSKANFFIIEHHFKEGKADEWWGEISKVLGDPKANASLSLWAFMYMYLLCLFCCAAVNAQLMAIAHCPPPARAYDRPR